MDGEGTVLIKEQFTSITCRNKWLLIERGNENSFFGGELQSKSQSPLLGLKAVPHVVEPVEEPLRNDFWQMQRIRPPCQASLTKGFWHNSSRLPWGNYRLGYKRKQNTTFCNRPRSPRDFCSLCWDLLFNRLRQGGGQQGKNIFWW